MGRDNFLLIHSYFLPCFNPRARVGRDGNLAMLECLQCLFQSTRPRGARLAIIASLIYKTLFQSTRPRGARQEWQEYERAVLDVSIHAPAWGATWKAYDAIGCNRCFNPRARVGRDPIFWKPSTKSEVSIHAPAWGATRLHAKHCGRMEGFNPRARVGRDCRVAYS